MNAPFSDLRAVDDLMGRPLSAADWAAQTAEALLALDPSIRLALCHRTDGEPPPTAVRAADGHSPPDPSAALRSEIPRLSDLDGTAHPSSALESVFGLRCLAACVSDERGPWAVLAVGTARDAPAEAAAAAEMVLTAWADALTLWRRLQSAERERDEFAGFALIGQAVTGLGHELNNLLNCIVLQASVLQIQLDEKYHPALDVIRRQAHQATGLLRPLGQASGERAKSSYAVDLGRAVREALRHDSIVGERIHFAPPAVALPPIRGTTGAVKQLVRLLLSAALTAAPTVLTVRIEAEGAGVQLVFDGLHLSEEGGEDSAPPTEENMFWARLGELERLAAQSLLRQLDGALRVLPGAADGVAVHICWGVLSDGNGRPLTQSRQASHSS